MSLPVSLLSLLALALASPTPPRPLPRSIPLSKSFRLSTDGVVDLSGLRTHASYVDTKYAHDTRRRQETALDLTSYRDLLWYGPVQVGSDKQEFLIDFDTGSSDFFIAGTACPSCAKHATYDPSRSTSAVATGDTFELKYGDGSQALGSVYLDTVSLSGLSATGVPVGSATFENGSFTTDICDGLMGMAFPALSVYETGTPFFNALMSQHAVAEGVFAFNLAGENASLHLGSAQPPFLAPGAQVFWNDVTRPLYWEIGLQQVSVGAAVPVRNTTAIVDTGTTLVVGPPSAVAAFYASIPGSAPAPKDVADGFYTFPCSAPPQDVAFTMGGVDYLMDPGNFNLGRLEQGSPLCVGAVYQQSRLNFWILGDAFLRGFASIFDFDNERMGFAQLA